MTDNLTDLTGNPRWSNGDPIRFTLGLNARIVPNPNATLIRDSDVIPTEVTSTMYEMALQLAKWGEQNHPNGTGPNICPLMAETEEFPEFDAPATQLADLFTESTNARMADGSVTWLDILLEEVFEAAAEEDLEKLDTELKQVAAVALSWRRALVRQQVALAPAEAA